MVVAVGAGLCLVSPVSSEDLAMLRWAITFFIIALIAAALGALVALDGVAMQAGRLLCVVFRHPVCGFAGHGSRPITVRLKLNM